ncbi:hypothetical protein [Actinoplanes sp. TFC3]|uniref:hypothetical protein n=1 Tax=Actinoplanes sp. TFC3 TaxID=1710355 RepID=UPI000AD94C0D|nr:hypothetical protein [Actinoplanes sp. TFC3]
MRRLRRRCEQRLAGLVIPHPFDLDAFAAVVAAHRGRPLTLRPMPGLGTGAPCGLWLSLASADYVFYDPGTSRLHAEHIVLHELAHMLSGHRTGLDVSGGALARLAPDLDPRTVERILGRVSYTTAQEREAEMMASLIRARAARPAPRTLGGGSLGRLADVLKFRL